MHDWHACAGFDFNMAARSVTLRQPASAACTTRQGADAFRSARAPAALARPSHQKCLLGASNSRALGRRRQAPVTTKAVFQTTSDNPAFRYGRFDEAKRDDYSSPPRINDNGPTEMTVSGAVDR